MAVKRINSGSDQTKNDIFKSGNEKRPISINSVGMKITFESCRIVREPIHKARAMTAALKYMEKVSRSIERSSGIASMSG
ncbi:MAG TPA: hypothetical protein DD738_09245, partial [Ruminiclostridium sp.]|nr:hypothetical protein [Ruminiclostridium sp.]